MTIFLYSGTPGSGKSLHAAREISWRLRYGKPVVTNFPINQERVKCPENYLYLSNDKLSPNAIKEFARAYWERDKRFREGAITVYIDECQMLFNSRDYNKRDRREWLAFFSLHRHYGLDIVLIAQADRMLDRQIRQCIEYEFVHRKLGNLGKSGAILKLVTLGEKFLVVKFWYQSRTKVGSSVLPYSKRVASIYDSYADFVPPE